MCKFKQIYKNVPGIGFFVKAGRPFAKRMEPHKFFDTNLLINLNHLKMGIAFASRIITVGSRSYGYSHTAKIMTVKMLYIFCYKLVEIRKTLRNHRRGGRGQSNITKD